jgi:ubiquinone/menaquinone biosynthesis C-methylase UbiE
MKSKHAYAIREYGRLASTYGNDLRAVDWGSRKSQTRRFEILATVGNLTGASILDVGCGLGDLYPWLKRRVRPLRYVGIDVTPEMIRLAQSRFPNTDFRVGDAAALLRAGRTRFDYVLASGIFSKQRERPLQAMKNTIRSMYRLARKGIAFNSLSAMATGKERGEFHADPAATLAFCQTLTPWVALRHDYHPRDFTVFLYKRKPG